MQHLFAWLSYLGEFPLQRSLSRGCRQIIHHLSSGQLSSVPLVAVAVVLHLDLSLHFEEICPVGTWRLLESTVVTITDISLLNILRRQLSEW